MRYGENNHILKQVVTKLIGKRIYYEKTYHTNICVIYI